MKFQPGKLANNLQILASHELLFVFTCRRLSRNSLNIPALVGTLAICIFIPKCSNLTMLCHANTCLHIKQNMMLSYRMLRMLTIILVYNVSLHMHLYYVIELKSISCGYQLIYSCANQKLCFWLKVYSYHYYYCYYYCLSLYFSIHRFTFISIRHTR